MAEHVLKFNMCGQAITVWWEGHGLKEGFAAWRKEFDWLWRCFKGWLTTSRYACQCGHVHVMREFYPYHTGWISCPRCGVLVKRESEQRYTVDVFAGAAAFKPFYDYSTPAGKDRSRGWVTTKRAIKEIEAREDKIFASDEELTAETERNKARNEQATTDKIMAGVKRDLAARGYLR